MRLLLIRATAFLLSGLWTAAYGVMLIGATWLYCYGTHPFCSAGWLPRTGITAIYVSVLATFLYFVRRVVRSCQVDAAEGRGERDDAGGFQRIEPRSF